jgi:Tol biopolymer transport system component
MVVLGGSPGDPDEPPGVYLVDANGYKRIGDRLYQGYRGSAHPEWFPVLGGPHEGWSPLTWSPDGSKAAFWECIYGPPWDSELYVMNSDGTGLTNVSNHPANDAVPCGGGDFSYAAFGEFAWSPDSGSLVFWSARSPWGLYTVNADGSGLRYLTDPVRGSNPAWSPAGGSILFACPQSSDFDKYEAPICTIEPDGSNRRLLARVPMDTNVLNSYSPELRWSPDGTLLAFTAHPLPASTVSLNYQVFVMNADGTGLINISGLPKNDPPGGGNHFASWVNCELPLPTAGCGAMVTNVEPQGLNVREGPGTDQDVIGGLSQGDTVCLLGVGAPALADGIQWWPLRTAEGTEGWVAAFDPNEPNRRWLTPTGSMCQGDQ